jgi:hypothetical protein
MGLPTNNKKNTTLPGNNSKSNNNASKFISKPAGNSKAVGAAKKPIKTGGTRGS